MSLVIRPSEPADIPAIAAIYADAVIHGTASFELEPPTEQEMACRRSALIESRFPYLVAERGGGVLGYAYAGHSPPRGSPPPPPLPRGTRRPSRRWPAAAPP